MAKSHRNIHSSDEEESEVEIYSEMEGFDSDEEDPTYNDNIVNFTKLSINNKSKSSNDEEMNLKKLGKEEMKSLEQVQKLIDCGQVEKLKVEQCKVYLREHGLRLTGKKDILIQRIKEHIEIINGGGEEKYPPSSFVLNCKGDACLGDIVMFEQTVYEGYSIVSRSACGPPCGKRIVAGRIVNESYGAAKQQHTFTVEVLWSKGQQPLPPLHPLLIKGRNLYKLDTRRQRWEDEAERQRVLSEKHSRGSFARSDREARIQEKLAKKALKGLRLNSRGGQNSHHYKNPRHVIDQIPLSESGELETGSQQQYLVAQKTRHQQTSQESACRVLPEFKGNSNTGQPRYQPSHHNIPNKPAFHPHQVPTSSVSVEYKAQFPIGPRSFQHSKPAEFSSGSQSHSGHLKCSIKAKAGPSDKFQPTQQDPRRKHFVEYKENPLLPVPRPHSFQQKRSTISTFHFNQEPKLYLSDCGNLIASSQGHLPFSDKSESYSQSILMNASCKHSMGPFLGPTRTQRQLCRHYPQGRCYYGNHCKFLHE